MQVCSVSVIRCYIEEILRYSKKLQPSILLSGDVGHISGGAPNQFSSKDESISLEYSVVSEENVRWFQKKIFGDFRKTPSIYIFKRGCRTNVHSAH